MFDIWRSVRAAFGSSRRRRTEQAAREEAQAPMRAGAGSKPSGLEGLTGAPRRPRAESRPRSPARQAVPAETTGSANPHANPLLAEVKSPPDAASMAKADAKIYSAVSSVVNGQWEYVAKKTRKALEPHGLAAMFDPVGASAHARAAQSVPREAPGGLVSDVHHALMSIVEGQAVRETLAKTGRTYRAHEHPEFHGKAQDMAFAGVCSTLDEFDRRVREKARATIEASAERDARVQVKRAQARWDEERAQTELVRARASESPGESTWWDPTGMAEWIWPQNTVGAEIPGDSHASSPSRASEATATWHEESRDQVLWIAMR